MNESRLREGGSVDVCLTVSSGEITSPTSITLSARVNLPDDAILGDGGNVPGGIPIFPPAFCKFSTIILYCHCDILYPTSLPLPDVTILYRHCDILYTTSLPLPDVTILYCHCDILYPTTLPLPDVTILYCHCDILYPTTCPCLM